MACEAEADSERASCTDADQVKDSVRRRCARILKRLLRVIGDIPDSAGHVDGNEVAMPVRLELRLVSLLVNPFTRVSDFLGRIQYVEIGRHSRFKTLPHNIQ